MATRKDGPQIPPPYDVPVAAALQALTTGTATADQQIRAIKWIVEVASGAYQFNFYPTDRETAFALGRTFVGQQIVKLTTLNLQALRSAKDVQTELRAEKS